MAIKQKKIIIGLVITDRKLLSHIWDIHNDLNQLRRLSYAVDLSQIVQERRVEFHYNMPHITLFQGMCTDADELISKLELLSLSPDDFRINLLELKTYHNGYIFWHVEKTASIQAIHEMIVRKASPLFITETFTESEIAKMVSKGKNINHINNSIKYGYSMCNDEYEPHITIGRTLEKRKIEVLPDHAATLVASKKGSQIIDFTVSIAEMGVDGSCTSVIHTF